MQNVAQLSIDTTIPAQVVEQEQSTEPLKRRVRQAGQRHGRAVGNAGVVTVSYTKGFMEGFASAFSEK